MGSGGIFLDHAIPPSGRVSGARTDDAYDEETFGTEILDEDEDEGGNRSDIRREILHSQLCF